MLVAENVRLRGGPECPEERSTPARDLKKYDGCLLGMLVADPCECVSKRWTGAAKHSGGVTWKTYDGCVVADPCESVPERWTGAGKHSATAAA